MPNGVLSSLSGNIFTLQWHSVLLDGNGQPITILQYRIDQSYSDIASSAPNKTVYVPASAQSYAETVGPTVNYYQVTALAAGGRHIGAVGLLRFFERA